MNLAGRKVPLLCGAAKGRDSDNALFSTTSLSQTPVILPVFASIKPDVSSDPAAQAPSTLCGDNPSNVASQPTLQAKVASSHRTLKGAHNEKEMNTMLDWPTTTKTHADWKKKKKI